MCSLTFGPFWQSIPLHATLDQIYSLSRTQERSLLGVLAQIPGQLVPSVRRLDRFSQTVRQIRSVLGQAVQVSQIGRLVSELSLEGVSFEMRYGLGEEADWDVKSGVSSEMHLCIRSACRLTTSVNGRHGRVTSRCPVVKPVSKWIPAAVILNMADSLDRDDQIQTSLLGHPDTSESSSIRLIDSTESFIDEERDRVFAVLVLNGCGKGVGSLRDQVII